MTQPNLAAHNMYWDSSATIWGGLVLRFGIMAISGEATYNTTPHKIARNSPSEASSLADFKPERPFACATKERDTPTVLQKNAIMAMLVNTAGPDATSESSEYLARHTRSINIMRRLPTMVPISGNETEMTLFARLVSNQCGTGILLFVNLTLVISEHIA
jgi:hypothetical protein